VAWSTIEPPPPTTADVASLIIEPTWGQFKSQHSAEPWKLTLSLVGGVLSRGGESESGENGNGRKSHLVDYVLVGGFGKDE